MNCCVCERDRDTRLHRKNVMYTTIRPPCPSRNTRAGNRLGGGWRAGRVAGDRLTLAGLQTPRCDGWLGQPAGASLLDTGWCQPRPSHPTASTPPATPAPPASSWLGNVSIQPIASQLPARRQTPPRACSQLFPSSLPAYPQPYHSSRSPAWCQPCYFDWGGNSVHC